MAGTGREAVSQMKKISLMLCALLAGCGGADSPDWSGGRYGVWQPVTAPIGVMILHQGHDCFDGCRYDDSLVPAAQAFAAGGFIVHGLEMPPDPHNAGPIERYYQPVLDILDSLDGSLPVYMAGLSGGGWTTMVVTGIDSRIKHGYNVEGGIGGDDWEQRNPPVPYDQLIATSQGRFTYIAIPGSAGPCPTATLYRCVNDPVAQSHVFSKWAVEFILADIASS